MEIKMNAIDPMNGWKNTTKRIVQWLLSSIVLASAPLDSRAEASHQTKLVHGFKDLETSREQQVDECAQHCQAGLVKNAEPLLMNVAKAGCSQHVLDEKTQSPVLREP